MTELVSRIGTVWLGLVAIVAVHVGAPAVARGCECCACDFSGDIQCGDGDSDCGLCIVLGGVPAPTCAACDGGDCDGNTLCAGDPQMCSTDMTGGCCVDNEFGNGCFLMTGTACASVAVQGMYRGDGSNCAAPCPAPNGASCTTPSDCASNFCVEDVCCNAACTGEFQRCNLPDQLGVCVGVAAPAPTLSVPGTIVAGVLLFGIAMWGLGRRRRRG